MATTESRVMRCGDDRVSCTETSNPTLLDVSSCCIPKCVDGAPKLHGNIVMMLADSEHHPHISECNKQQVSLQFSFPKQVQGTRKNWRLLCGKSCFQVGICRPHTHDFRQWQTAHRSEIGRAPVAVNPFTPKSDQCQISSAASPEINITSYSMENLAIHSLARWKISDHYTTNSHWENVLFEP